MKTLKLCLLGIYLLLQSPSSIFALLALACVSYITLKQPSVGGLGFVALFPVTIGLVLAEHREQMASIMSQNVPPPPPAPIIETNNPRGNP